MNSVLPHNFECRTTQTLPTGVVESWTTCTAGQIADQFIFEVASWALLLLEVRDGLLACGHSGVPFLEIQMSGPSSVVNGVKRKIETVVDNLFPEKLKVLASSVLIIRHPWTAAQCV